jgi:hypothetical protein
MLDAVITTLTLQDAPGRNVAGKVPQVFVWLKSAELVF